MFKKDKNVFHLEEESVRRERKEKRFLWVSFVLIVLFSVMAVFFVLKKNDFQLHNFFDPDSKTTTEESTSSPDGGLVVPSVSGKSNLLLLGTDADKKVLEYALLIQCDLDAMNFKICALPVNVLTNVSGRADTLQGQLLYGGPTQAVRAVSQLAGQTVERYVLVSSDKFESIGRKLGTISYTVPEAVSYVKGEVSLKLNKGEQSLTPETVLKLMQYNWNGDTGRQRGTQAQLAANALDQLLSKENVAKSEKLFSEIVNLVDTDITVADFTKSKNALVALSQGEKRKPSETVAVTGAAQNNGVALSGDSGKVLQEKFATQQS